MNQFWYPLYSIMFRIQVWPFKTKSESSYLSLKSLFLNDHFWNWPFLNLLFYKTKSFCKRLENLYFSALSGTSSLVDECLIFDYVLGQNLHYQSVEAKKANNSLLQKWKGALRLKSWLKIVNVCASLQTQAF